MLHPIPWKHLLHVFPTFGVGGAELHFAEVINHLGPIFQHTIIALDGNSEAKARLDGSIPVNFPLLSFDKHKTSQNIWVFRKLLKRLQPDLLTTCNWGSMEWTMANSFHPVCPEIHLEHGFGPDEYARQKPLRLLARRFFFSRVSKLLVPSNHLLMVAQQVWAMKSQRIIHIPNGLNCARFERKSYESSPGGDIIIGTVARLRKEKNLTRLLRIFSKIAQELPCRLWIVGDGPELNLIRESCASLNPRDRVKLFGHIPEPANLLNEMDVFAMTSDTEQMPISVLEAMAAKLPIIATDVGDIRLMVAPENRDFIVDKNDETEYLAKLKLLVKNETLRRQIGLKNHEKCMECFDIKIISKRYLDLFESVMSESKYLLNS